MPLPPPFPQPKLVTSFFLLPGVHCPPIHTPFGPRGKGSHGSSTKMGATFIFTQGLAYPESAPLGGSRCELHPHPHPEPTWGRRQSLAGDFSKYEHGTKSQVPRPLWPRRLCKHSPARLRDRRELGAVGSTAPAAGSPVALLREGKGLPGAQCLINRPQPLQQEGERQCLLKCVRIRDVQIESFLLPLSSTPPKLGMLVKNSLVVAVILHKPMAGREMKERGYVKWLPLGSGKRKSQGMAVCLKRLRTRFCKAWIFTSKQIFCSSPVCELHLAA